jgi:4-amino-4-deoxy-L-arabinose transferase-like glycosyltransferase
LDRAGIPKRSGGLSSSPHRIALVLLLAYYLAVSVRHLTVVPPVFEDEPWFASTAFKLANDGVFGSDVFAGFHGLEHHYYGFPPVAPLLMAGAVKLIGFGLFQIRLESVLLGAITLLLTYVVGRRLFNPMVGLLAVAFLLFVRTGAESRSSPTGILLLDVARIARYDMPVPVFGLAALLTYLVARDRDRWWLYVLAGCFGALSMLGHLYGVFWIVAIGVLASWDHRQTVKTGRYHLAPVALLGTGFVLTCLPYALYVLADLHSWRAQTRNWAPRFDLLHPSWYVTNLLGEPRRYAPGLGELGSSWLLRVGLWTSIVAIPASIVGLARRGRTDPGARALAVPVILIPALFALLITMKFWFYKVGFWPLFALAVAWGTWTLWQAAGAKPARRWWRSVMVALGFTVVGEGLTRVAELERLAASTSPYERFIARVRQHIPHGTRVLGLHNYWLGLEDTRFRSWWVPLVKTVDGAPGGRPLTLETLHEIDPEIVLLDVHIRRYLDAPANAYGGRHTLVKAWLRDWAVAAAVDDRTYGRMEILRRAKPDLDTSRAGP